MGLLPRLISARSVAMIQDTLTRLLEEAAAAAAPDLGLDRAEIPTPELLKPRLKEHGNWSTNIALVLAPQVGRAPREVAESLAARIPTDDRRMRSSVGMRAARDSATS